MIYYFCLFISISIGVLGQISLKAGSMQSAPTSLFFLFQPYIFLGLCFYFVSAMFYIFSLRHIPLSVAFPSVSLSYAAVAILAHYIWKEPFTIHHSIALILIMSGVCLLIRA